MLMRASMTFRRITENQDQRVRENSLNDYEYNSNLSAATVFELRKQLKLDQIALLINI